MKRARRARPQILALAVAAALLAAPGAASAAPRLLDETLRAPVLADGRDPQLAEALVAVALRLDAPDASAGAAPAPDRQGSSSGGDRAGKPAEGTRAPQPGSLEFDLLGAPSKRPVIDEGALRLRRKMLTWHQGVGLGMFALDLATTVVGQLNYIDKFGGANTGRYVQPHAVLAYSTLAAFAAAGTLALLAPRPFERTEGFDRVSLHKWSMLVATAGMVTEGVLGIWTKSREGYLDQQGIATAHLVIGYVTLAAIATGVSALVF